MTHWPHLITFHLHPSQLLKEILDYTIVCRYPVLLRLQTPILVTYLKFLRQSIKVFLFIVLLFLIHIIGKSLNVFDTGIKYYNTLKGCIRHEFPQTIQFSNHDISGLITRVVHLWVVHKTLNPLPLFITGTMSSYNENF